VDVERYERQGDETSSRFVVERVGEAWQVTDQGAGG
jgi:hypothetical protein